MTLTKAGEWSDDSQVASLLVVRGDQVDGGAVIVMVESLAAAPSREEG